MKPAIDIDAILAPIPGEIPAGEDLRYSLHEDIKEARRADDILDQGDWQHDIKRADWAKVISLCTDALMQKSKDLQIAAWLTEALTVTQGFEGLDTGLKIINGLLENFWEHVYPAIEDDDLEFRAGRIEYVNNSVWARVKDIPLTDSSARAGYSWTQWDQSRQVGYEVDSAKAEMRAQLIAEGKLAPEEFDAAVAQSSRNFYENLAAAIAVCKAEFDRFDQLVDQRFGDDAPRLAELRKSIEDCDTFVVKVLKEKQHLEPDEAEAEAPTPPPDSAHLPPATERPSPANLDSLTAMHTNYVQIGAISDVAAQEKLLWDKAGELYRSSGMKAALQQLLVAAATAPSVREKNRYRLMMARLCLNADRPDLARPILEKLSALIDELKLELWESPQWIAEVLEALYKCLTAGGPDEDQARANELFRKICTLDVTKAMLYKTHS
jgi:type VI secretion system protein ImpA